MTLQNKLPLIRIFSIIIIQFFLLLPYSNRIYAKSSYNFSKISTSNGLSGNIVNDIFVDDNNVLWVATQAGVSLIDAFSVTNLELPNNIGSRFSSIRLMDDNSVLLTKDKLNAVFVDYGYMKSWIDSVSGYRFRDINGRVVYNDVSEYDSINRLININFDKKLYVNWSYEPVYELCMLSHGAYFFTYNGLTYLGLQKKINYINESISTSNVARIEDELLFMQPSGCLVRLLPDNNSILESPIHQFAKNARIIKSDGNSIFIVSQDSIFHLKYNQYEELELEYLFDNRYIAQNAFKCLIIDSGNLVFATKNDGILLAKKCYLRKAFSHDSLAHVELLSIGGSRTIISLNQKKIYSDNKKDCWLTGEKTKGFAIRAFLETNNHCVYYTLYKNNSSFLYKAESFCAEPALIGKYQDNITCLYKDLNDNLWYAGSRNIGYIQKGKDIEVLTSDKPQYKVTNFLQLNADSFLYTTNKGLFILDTKRAKKFEYKELSGVECRDIKSIDDSLHLITTYGKGVYFFNGKNLSKLRLDFAGQLSFTHKILEYNDSLFIIMCNNGVSITTKKNIKRWIYNNEELYLNYLTSIKTYEYNGNGKNIIAIDSSNVLYFPTMSGIVSLNVLDIKRAKIVVPIKIREVIVNGEIHEDKASITLAPGDNSIDIQLFGDIRFRGNMNGYYYALTEVGDSDIKENKWKYISRGHLHFDKLSHGKYTLTIMKKEVLDEKSSTYKTIQINVMPYWYETMLFKIISIIILLGGASLVWYLRQKELTKTNALLNKKIDVATQGLRRRNAIHNKLMNLLSHELLGRLNAVNTIIRLNDLNQKNDTCNAVSQTLKDTEQSVEHILNWLILDKENFVLKYELIKLADLVTKSIDKVYVLNKDNTSLVDTSQVDQSVVVYSDKYVLEVLMVNIITNAKKYGRGSTVIITTEVKKESILITIIDEGPGFNKEVLEYIDLIKSDNFVYRPMNKDVKSGLGIEIIIELVALLKGQVSFSNVVENAGARVVLTLPIATDI